MLELVVGAPLILLNNLFVIIFIRMVLSQTDGPTFIYFEPPTPVSPFSLRFWNTYKEAVSLAGTFGGKTK